MLRRHLRVYGRVQGVFFRAWSERRARVLGLAGWVRNRRDGSVEILVEGDPATVTAFVAECRGGPPDARVERIEEEAALDDELLSGFVCRPTL